MELLAPAGDFFTAITAFKSGADAVYLGLKQFSARRGAVNFDWMELARLLGYAKQHDKKVFVTLNTVIKEEEFPDIIHVLTRLTLLQVDAVIVQDIGLAFFIHKNFPSLEIHASTQMCVHSVEGLKEAAQLGISRVVLPRELSLLEIEHLKKEVPNMELEVFIHGALCYSVSGLCLASGLLLDRSGNRGACAQMCRSHFTRDGQNLYPFSCRDLWRGEDIVKLQSMRVDSFKIEGRLKGADYVEAVVSYYRMLLEGDKEKAEFWERKIKLSFARRKTKGFQDEKLLDMDYPKSRGIFIGKVQAGTKGNTLRIRSSEKFSRGDRLLFLRDGFNEMGVAALIADVKFQRGETLLSFKEQLPWHELKEVYKLSEAFQKKKKFSDDIKIFPALKSQYDLQVKRTNEFLELKSSLPLLGERVLTFEVESWPLAEKESLEGVFRKIFMQSGEAPWELNKLLMAEDVKTVYLPPAFIKNIRKQWYLFLDEELQKYGSSFQIKNNGFSLDADLSAFVARRRNLFWGELPFWNGEALQEKIIPVHSSFSFLCLHPFLNLQEAEKLLDQYLREHQDVSLCLGINNLSHLGLIRTLKKNHKIYCFADFYFYSANGSVVDFWHQAELDCLFAYAWVEDKNGIGIQIKDKESLPLFISRACLIKHLNAQGHCANHCDRSFSTQFKNGKDIFLLIVKDCWTYMFRQV